MGKQAENSGFREQISNFMRNNVMFANSDAENMRIWKNIIFSYAGKWENRQKIQDSKSESPPHPNLMRHNVMFAISKMQKISR